jgi:hypothetical protein
MFRKKVFPKIFIIMVFLLFFNLFTVSFGDNKSRLNVVNRTRYYLHIVVEGTVYPYVARNVTITHTTDPQESMYYEVFYSPGQNLSTEVIGNYVDIPYSPSSTTTSGDSYSCDCQDDNFSCSESNKSVVNVPAQGGSVTLEITEDLFNN